MKPDTKSFYVVAVQKAIEDIVGGLDGALDLEALAREAALSPFHFHRVFRGMVGETPLEMHRRLRMERAAQSLQLGDAMVTVVAFDAGYETHEAFTRAFRARYGCSPVEFRKRSEGRPPGCPSPPQTWLTTQSGVHFGIPVSDDTIMKLLMREKTMEAKITKEKGIRVAALRHIGPYHTIGESFGKLYSIAVPAGLLGPASMMVGIYHDDPETTPEAELRSDAAVAIPESAQVPDGLSEIRIPAGTYACTTHIGSYEGLGDAWSRLMGEWLPQSGRRVGEGVCYEVHRNDPTRTPKEELRTDLFLPIIE